MHKISNAIVVAFFLLVGVGVCVGAGVALLYIGAVVIHTIGPDNWRWLSSEDKIRLLSTVRGGTGASTLLLGALLIWWRRKEQKKDEKFIAQD